MGRAPRYTLSLHDALPISWLRKAMPVSVRAIRPLTRRNSGWPISFSRSGTCRLREGWDGKSTALHSFPTRRSSDLMAAQGDAGIRKSYTPFDEAKQRMAYFVFEVAHLPAQRGLRSEEHTSELQS